jgi:AraC-like DNA-binding protein
MNRPQDPLDAAIAELRFSGSVLLQRTHVRPWAIAVPAESRLREVLNLPADSRVVPFHLVRRGALQLKCGKGQKLQVMEGEAVFCLHGGMYQLSDGRADTVLDMERIMSGTVPRRVQRRTGVATELMCGVITMPAAPLSPVLAALPPILRVSAADSAQCPVLTGIVSLLLQVGQSGHCSPLTTDRMLEAFFGEAIRAYRRSHGGDAPGWFGALADGRIARTMQLIHARPWQRWTVTELSRKAGLSPSRYAARFRERCGQSVMAYVSSVRFNASCQLIRDTDLPLCSVAERVGYNSLPGFSRAFKALIGQSPARWRAAQRAARSHRGTGQRQVESRTA